MANPQYRWYLVVGGVGHYVYPIYKDDMTLNYERESGQRFFRAKLSGKVTFVGDDAMLIINAAFTSEFLLTIQVSNDYGLTWTAFYYSHFYKTDCTINVDDKKVSVQPEPYDRYRQILAGLDKEFDLIKLNPVIQPVRATKRPMFQIYVEGIETVSCLSGSQAFERDVVNGSTEEAERCHFKPFGVYWEINISNSGDVGFNSPFTGAFTGNGSTFNNVQAVYRIEYFESTVQMPYRYENTNGLRIVKVSDSSVYAEWSQTISSAYTTEFAPIPADMTFTHDGTQMAATKTAYDGAYGRMVMDNNNLTVNGQSLDVFPIEIDDMVAQNNNYHYCVGFAEFDYQQSTRTSETPTEWGINSNGRYFLPPNDTDAWFPVGRSRWINTSTWIKYDATIQLYETLGRHGFTIKDTFPLDSVISVLLAQVAPGISFAASYTYSEFLYGSQMPLGVRGSQMFIAPKSNIIMGEYQEPAQKAPITLGDVLTMLRKVYNCYWWIDSAYHLRIEHISWFQYGGTYSGVPVIGYDLTQMENVRNGKKWAFDTAEYHFEKEEMPERYQYGWMDDVTLMFQGNPIDVISPFVQQGKIEEVTVANFTSDVDYMLMAPELCSKDGFAILQCNEVQDVWSIPILTVTPSGSVYTYDLQNWILSMYYLQMFFLTWNMPAWSIKRNGVTETAGSIMRLKVQTMMMPLPNFNLDSYGLVRTTLGDGEFGAINLSLASKMAKVTIKYDTYDNE